MTGLHVVMLSHNQFEEFPEGLSSEDLQHLNTIAISSNAITTMPDDLSNLQALKNFDMSNNKLTAIPFEFSLCQRLKEINLVGNKVKDRRLHKLIEQGCKPKSMLDYLATALAKQNPPEKGSKKKDRGKGRKAKKSEGENEEVEKVMDKMEVLRISNDDVFTIQITENVASVRPHIVCCIVRNLDFQKSLNMFKHFITLQTRLHDTICQKRVAATIATHDLQLVTRPLKYDARQPERIQITPLFGHKEVSAGDLVKKLKSEAEAFRKEKKRHTYSGIHKYLELLDGKELYPCLTDGQDRVLSFPPITNSDVSKICKSTEAILIEVTSSSDMHICKKVLDELLKGMLEMGCSKAPAGGTDGEAAGGASAAGGAKVLTVEQVRILDTEGLLKVVYPSRTDLNFDSHSIEVIRHEK